MLHLVIPVHVCVCCDLAVKNDSARVENVRPVTSFDKLNFTDGIYIYLSEHVTR